MCLHPSKLDKLLLSDVNLWCSLWSTFTLRMINISIIFALLRASIIHGLWVLILDIVLVHVLFHIIDTLKHFSGASPQTHTAWLNSRGVIRGLLCLVVLIRPLYIFDLMIVLVLLIGVLMLLPVIILFYIIFRNSSLVIEIFKVHLFIFLNLKLFIPIVNWCINNCYIMLIVDLLINSPL